MMILKFILFLFIAMFILALVIAYSFINKVRETTRRFQERQNRTKTTVGGNVIYDRRTPEQSQKRIIPDDEGEYVDYEE